MNISSIFRIFGSTSVVKTSSCTSAEITHSAKQFLKALKGVKNTAESRGSKIYSMYQKTESDAHRLIKNAQKGNVKKTLENVRQLKKHSDILFYTTSNPFNRDFIATAKAERSNIASALMNNKLSLR
ncbi:hypothetical protein [Aeromonas cavernicola]|uniref:hypothetical protein n=1 Tax=Aeromonas cavernicola TaxID=1006623 RepID=UPI0012FE2908|nr:hypothetical protein [Aeromonas cavernicola]